MSNLKVCEGLEVVNVNGHRLETLRRTSNTIDTGADAILEGLSLFADDLLDKYEEESTIPYQKLFWALKQIISSGAENESVRDAIMTGIINETKSGIPVARVPKKKEVVQPKPKEPKARKSYNKSAITKYAKTHTIKEIQEHFEFPSRAAAKLYIYNHDIAYVIEAAGRKGPDLDVEQVRALAKDMRLYELVNFFGYNKYVMISFCRKHNIEYKKR